MEDFERMYNEAHEAAEKIHRFSSDPKEIKRMEELFPDLKMSEDERMRRNLKPRRNRKLIRGMQRLKNLRKR